MNTRWAGILGGLAGGVVMTLVMQAGRRTRSMPDPLDEATEDWLDRTANTRGLVGQTGTTAIEQTNHAAASLAPGLGYALLRERLPAVPPALLGTGYGTVLYLVNIAGIAPLLGITGGECAASPTVRAQRLGLHAAYGLVTALVAQALSRRQG